MFRIEDEEWLEVHDLWIKTKFSKIFNRTLWTYDMLLDAFVVLKRWNLGLSGSRIRFSDILYKIFNDSTACGSGFGRVIPGSMSLLNFWRFSRSATNWAGDGPRGSCMPILRSTAARVLDRSAIREESSGKAENWD